MNIHDSVERFTVFFTKLFKKVVRSHDVSCFFNVGHHHTDYLKILALLIILETLLNLDDEENALNLPL